jgi:DNA (cytosine-5)-methyltransferase 1
MNELALFAGYGGGILGGKILGWKTVCAVERDAYAATILAKRQNDGFLEPFPIWSDITTFDGRPWQGIVDVISGGFPCQDISCAGKGKGIDGERSGLWREFARIIGEARPRYVFVENSPMLVVRGLNRVIGDLAALGYDANWGIISAADAGANHLRKRIWIRGVLANTLSSGKWRESRKEETSRNVVGGSIGDGSQNVSHATGTQCKGNWLRWGQSSKYTTIGKCSWWMSEPKVGRVAHGCAFRVERLKCIGNAQVPSCSALAWSILS